MGSDESRFLFDDDADVAKLVACLGAWRLDLTDPCLSSIGEGSSRTTSSTWRETVQQ